MSPAADHAPLPHDLAACQALIASQRQSIESQTQTIESQSQTIESHIRTIAELHEKTVQLEQEKQELKLTLTELLQRAFRRRSERYLHDPQQLFLDFGQTADAADAAEGLAQAVDEAEQTVREHTRRRHPRKPRNDRLPEHLPRYEVEAEAPEDIRHCPAHGPRKVIGYDTTETLEFERPKLKVRVTKYPKYACPNEPVCGVASPERPTGLVEGDRYDTSVAAEVITGKYAYHRVQGQAVSKMRVGLSRSGDRTWSQTSPSCGGQEPSW